MNELIKIGINWETLREESAPFKPEVKDNQDTSNHLQKNKVYEENEISNPFFSKNNDNSDVLLIKLNYFLIFRKKVKKAKSILGRNKINVKRYDLLDEENQKKARELGEAK